MKIVWKKDLLYNEIDKHAFIGNLDCNFNANYLQWSPNNQYLSVNLMDKLVIFEVNIHRLNDERRNVLSDNVGERLAFRSIEIWPDQSESDYSIKMGELAHNRPVSLPRFIDFRFTPSKNTYYYQILACLTNHNVLIIYLSLNPLEWKKIFNVTKWLNDALKKQSATDDYKDYLAHLNQIRISAFEWYGSSSASDDKQNCVTCKLCFVTKEGHLYLSELIIDSDCNSELKILKKIKMPNQTTIITLKVIEKFLLIQYQNGQIDLFNLTNHEHIIPLWTVADYKIVMNFGIQNNVDDNMVEIIFSKYDSLIIIKLNTLSKAMTMNEILIEKLNDDLPMEYHYDKIFAIFNQYNYNCLTTMNNEIISFSIFDHQTLLMRKLIHKSMMKNSNDMNYISVLSSSNKCLLAVLSSQNRFSGKMTNFKTKNIFLYLLISPTINQSLNIEILSKRLFVKNYQNNLADLLFIIRYYLLASMTDNRTFNSIIDLLLTKVPIWIEMTKKKMNNEKIKLINWSNQLKTIRYLALYCLIDGQRYFKQVINDNDHRQEQSENIKKLINLLNLLIMKNRFRLLSRELMTKIMKNGQLNEQLSNDQLLSLKNLCQSNMIDFMIPKSVMKQIMDKSIEQSCPICSRMIDKILDENYCCGNHQNGHRYDIDANSLLILNPLKHSNIVQCYKCNESKLFIRDDRSNLWQSFEPEIDPFRTASKCCPICL